MSNQGTSQNFTSCGGKGKLPPSKGYHNSPPSGWGSFNKTVLDKGKESLLGTQVADLDNDGDLDIASIGWDNYKFVHLWGNDEIDADTHNWNLVSSTNGEIEVQNSGNQQTASLVVDVDKDGAMNFFISERTAASSLTLFKYTNGKWVRHIVDAEPLHIEAGSASHDIGGDGDLDVLGKPYTWNAPLLHIWIKERPLNE